MVIVIVKAKVMVRLWSQSCCPITSTFATLMFMVSRSNAGYREVDLQMAAEVRNKMTKATMTRIMVNLCFVLFLD